MALLALEHSRTAYAADFVLYGGVVVALSGLLIWRAPLGLWPELALLVVAGLLSWTWVEYVLHRFVLHGLQPFKGWHEAHHARPSALICAPTLFSAMLFLILVFLPTLLLSNIWDACALSLGLVTGYLAYAITHHAVHHCHGNNSWLKKRKHWHGLHHSRVAQSGRYGVTSGLWDKVCGTGRPRSL